MRAIFGEKAREVRDTSLKVPTASPGKSWMLRCLAGKTVTNWPPVSTNWSGSMWPRKERSPRGTEMAGRHGNKGCHRQDPSLRKTCRFFPTARRWRLSLTPLAFRPDEYRPDLRDPFGLGRQGPGIHVASPVFDGATEDEILEFLKKRPAGVGQDNPARRANWRAL